MFRKIVLIVMLGLLLSVVGLSQAQEMPPLPGEEVLSGLGAVRGIAFDADGTLYVAEAGTGGEVGTHDGLVPEGEDLLLRLGMTGESYHGCPRWNCRRSISAVFQATGIPAERETIGRPLPGNPEMVIRYG